jgi:hypothetical protein
MLYISQIDANLQIINAQKHKAEGRNWHQDKRNPSKYSRQVPRSLRPCAFIAVGSAPRIDRGRS